MFCIPVLEATALSFYLWQGRGDCKAADREAPGPVKRCRNLHALDTLLETVCFSVAGLSTIGAAVLCMPLLI